MEDIPKDQMEDDLDLIAKSTRNKLKTIVTGKETLDLEAMEIEKSLTESLPRSMKN